MRIIPGEGFYINATLQNAMLNLKGNSTSLALQLRNGSTYLINGKTITLKAIDLNVLLRKPYINTNGIGQFTDLYTYHNLYHKIKALGSDCKIKGSFTFTGLYGDTYTITKQFNYNGITEISQPLYKFDELKSLLETLPYLFIITLCYIAFATIEKGKRKQ